MPDHKAKKPIFDLKPPERKPIFTVLVAISMIACLSSGKYDWVHANAISANRLVELMATGFGKLLPAIWLANFAQLTPWVFPINGFLIFKFGSRDEFKLPGLKYPVFVLVGVLLPWILLYLQPDMNQARLYIGPIMFIAYLMGGYVAFYPKKPFTPSDWTTPNWQIQRATEKKMEPEERWVPPWIYITVFLIYAGLMQFMMSVTKDQFANLLHWNTMGKLHEALIGRQDTVLYAFNPLIAFECIAAGAIFAYMLSLIKIVVKTKRPGGKLQIQVLQHYKHLRTLDMTHDQACEGAAKLLSVPLDVAKDWINKGLAAVKEDTKDQ